MYLEHWLELAAKWADNSDRCRSRVLDEILKGKGVPSQVRGLLWMEATGAKTKLREQPNRYIDALNTKTVSSVASAISRDIKRTFPLFLNTPDLLAEQSLSNVLLALSVAVPDVGYHQGLNFIVAMLLLTLKKTTWAETEQDAFWVALTLLNDYHMAGLFHSNSSFLQQFIDQFDILFRRFLPRLHSHLAITLEPKLEPALFAVDWFTTLFTYSLNLDAALMVWDCFLVARLDEALYVTGLALLLHLAEFETDDSLENVKSVGDAMDKLKKLKLVTVDQLRESLTHVVDRLIPSTLMPPGHSTLFRIERELQDPGNPYTTPYFGASQLIQCVQLGKTADVRWEVQKYCFPVYILEYCVVRAVVLGYADVVDVLVSVAGCHPDCKSTLKEIGVTPLHLAALLGHGSVCRVLLARGAALQAKCKMKTILEFMKLTANRVTALDIASKVLSLTEKKRSSALMVLKGDVCISCGVVLKKQVESEITLLSSLFAPGHPEAVERGGSSGELSFCAECFTREKIKQNRKRLTWQTARSITLDRPLGPLSWSCQHCGIVLLEQKKVSCKRCFFSFCVTCAFTFRTLRYNSSRKLVRVCQNCHHILRSCPCSSLPTSEVDTFSESNSQQSNIMAETHTTDTTDIESIDTYSQHSIDTRRRVLCVHMPFDYLTSTSSERTGLEPHCSCVCCIGMQYRVREPLVKSRHARYNRVHKQSKNGSVVVGMLSCEQAWLRGYGVLYDGGVVGHELLVFVRDVMNIVQMEIDKAVARNPSNTIHHQNNITSSVDEKVEDIDYAAEVKVLYCKYNPSKKNKVGEILLRFKGREKELLQSLKTSYGINT